MRNPLARPRIGVALFSRNLFHHLTLVAVLVAVAPTVVAADDWEPLEVRRAADVVSAEILDGAHYKIGDAVETDGFLNFYDLQTDFGTLSADSDWELEIRLAEVAAMVELAKVTKSKAFANSLGDVAMAPVDAAADLVTDPIGTTKAVGKGVANLFRSTKRVAKKVTAKKEEPVEGAEPEEGGEEESAKSRSLADQALGTDKQRRLWAYKLRIDPYSDNEVLDAELERVAKASAMGGSSLKIRTFETMEGGMPNVGNDLYLLGVLDLRARNEKILADAGLTAESFDAFEPFFDSPSLSPTLQTIIVDDFARLAGVEGREELLRMAAAMLTVDEARFQVGQTEFLAAYHERTKKLVRIQGGRAVPAAVAEDGEILLAIAADHLLWTEDLAVGLKARLDSLDAETGGEKVDLWVAGDATEKAIRGLEAMGVRVRTSEF